MNSTSRSSDISDMVRIHVAWKKVRYMFLSNGNNWIDLNVAGYEFPDRTGGSSDFDWDANWLNLYCNKNIDGGHKCGVFPCILTTDAARIIDLLTDYQAEKIDKIEFGGIEPNFAFYLTRLENGNELRIFFHLENSGEDYDDVKDFVKIIDDDEIDYIKNFWVQVLENFPIK